MRYLLRVAMYVAIISVCLALLWVFFFLMMNYPVVLAGLIILAASALLAAF